MSDALRARLSALVRDSGRAIERAGHAVAESAGDWSTRIGALRDAQRIRDSRSRAAERALPGEEIAPGVRLVQSAAPLVPVVGGASAPMPFAKRIGAEAPPTTASALTRSQATRGRFKRPRRSPAWKPGTSRGRIVVLRS